MYAIDYARKGAIRKLLDFAREVFLGRDDMAVTPPLHPSPGGHQRDCVLVIDVSGSMAAEDWYPSRLAAAKNAGYTFCERLRAEAPDARVGVVAFGNYGWTAAPLTPVKYGPKLHNAIAHLHVSGKTCMIEGLEQALRLLGPCRGNAQVVLLSDGFNTGPDPREVAQALKQRATVECVGIGGSPKEVDEVLLRTVATTKPDGTVCYRWIGDQSRLVRHFQDLAGRISVS